MTADGFGRLLHAEWTKFRTVPGWTIGMLAAVLVTVLVGLLGPATSSVSCSGPNGGPCGHNTPPTGPDGTLVHDGFYFVHRPLAGDGGITARVTSLAAAESSKQPGVEPWAKAGIIVKESTEQGSAYAAVMVTGGHGVRMQHDYTDDRAGLPGTVSAASPRWLRLTRSGDTVTGYDSADGTRWNRLGTAQLTGLPSTVLVGLFVSSPEHTEVKPTLIGLDSIGGPTLATASFDEVELAGTDPAGTWTGVDTRGGSGEHGPGVGFERAGDRFTVSGSGDIAPIVPGQASPGRTVENSLVGAFAGLIVLIVVATQFVTAEYRRGLIRTTLAASPGRGRLLAAKAVVVGSATFVAGLAAAAAAIPLVGWLTRAKGSYLHPVPASTVLRVVVGTAALLAVAAVLTLAVGTVLRRSAGAVTAVIVAIVLPYLLAVASVLPDGVTDWLLRITPAAAFAVQQSVTEYPQVTAGYTVADGYFPLPPLAGFAVLCGYAALAVGLAVVVLRRRDA